MTFGPTTRPAFILIRPDQHFRGNLPLWAGTLTILFLSNSLPLWQLSYRPEWKPGDSEAHSSVCCLIKSHIFPSWLYHGRDTERVWSTFSYLQLKKVNLRIAVRFWPKLLNVKTGYSRVLIWLNPWPNEGSQSLTGIHSLKRSIFVNAPRLSWMLLLIWTEHISEFFHLTAHISWEQLFIPDLEQDQLMVTGK